MIAPGGDADQAEVVVGVDTHKDCHVAVAISMLGVVLGTGSFPVSAAGYQELLDWARATGQVKRAGVEGTGSYGAGLTRALHAAGVEVLEINRPNRALRRRRGKTDAVDAEAAARAVLSGEAAVVPKNGDGPVEAIRVLKIAKDSASKARVQAVNQLRSVLVNASSRVREPLEHLSLPHLIVQCSTGSWTGLEPAELALTCTLGRLARRVQYLDAEIKDALKQITALIQQTAPDLLQVQGIGPDSAAALLIAAGDNPDRLRGEASFAALCGTSPVEASSGKTSRRRLSRGGNRQANAALFRAVLSRLRWDPTTQKYLQRRTAEGLSKREIIRCLKRYLARTVFKILRASFSQPNTT
ncbi:IS110 family transposase [Streptomyces sp. MI02-7b]|uniref:IS110 family transposase n=1 Tax=Streptomyces sp. MI02-7b TaxID=462941 RepID=UPI0029BC7D58|nr:IS110 family transposase [Streptomyces sp. MI02-7b]MDX3078646.1 IS110 family transposase [Streptomyces sp. MI02-7b]